MTKEETALDRARRRVEEMSRELHAIYMAEVRRQGDVVRHSDDYDALSESTKNYDRVLARWIIAREDALEAQVKRLRDGAIKQAHEIEQILGKALGYPWYKDDPKSFPDATEADGVCVGDHVAESLAAEAADRIDRLRARADVADWLREKLRHRSGVNGQFIGGDAATDALEFIERYDPALSSSSQETGAGSDG